MSSFLGRCPSFPLKFKLIRRADDQLPGLCRARLRLGARPGLPLANGFLRGMLRLVAHPAHQLMQRRHPREIGSNHVRHIVRVPERPIRLRAVMLEAEMLFDVQRPQILRHMKKVEFDPFMLQPHAMEWFMTLYIRVLPYAFTVRIFDVLLSRGYYVVFRVAMALFEIMKKQILATTEYPDLMQMLKNPTESCPELSKMTPDDFMKTVMRYKVTQKMVDKLVVQYKKRQEQKITK